MSVQAPWATPPCSEDSCLFMPFICTTAGTRQFAESTLIAAATLRSELLSNRPISSYDPVYGLSADYLAVTIHSMKAPLDKLHKFLRLEAERGFDDRAVFGGLRTILQ